MFITHPPRSLLSLIRRHFASRFSSSQAKTLATLLLLLPPHSPRPHKESPISPTTRALTGGGGIPRRPMAETEENNVVVVPEIPPAEDEDAKHGFTRPEMYQSNLAGTVDPYDRHVFLCFKSPSAWLPRVEDSETDPLPKLLASAFKARKADIAAKTKLTISEGKEGSDFEDGDVLIFPEMIKYKGLKDADVDGFVDDVLVNGKPWASGIQEVLTGSHIFVCAHASRDKRCGVCGPILIQKLQEGIESRGLKDQVFVSACSHVGGHKYAGNLIVFSPNSEGNVVGSWYGYVTPNDVPEILDQHIGKGVVIERLLRGQMVKLTEGGEKVSEEKLPNGNDVKESKRDEESKTEIGKENVTEVGKDNMTGCCQGTNGFSCCREESSEPKEETEQKKNAGLGKLSCWIQSLDQSDVLAAAAVVGAVATIAVAYSFYKRSG
ncbi:hypothetical protein Tsubulata_004791 [Turnera subulata]|uniref:Altered inheritance of mitochondria protein 32 n=1 Tax=Turnera subulata TaxID=218843 RepID=A0A9Q0FBA0_9ROSI|nr:hypothetical protein Tsubulata_004791 [Turnera subulata]